MSLWSRLWDWLKFEPKESTPGRDQASTTMHEGPFGGRYYYPDPVWHSVPRPPEWKGKGFDPEGGDIVVEEGGSLSPYVFRFEDLPVKWAEDYVDTLPPLERSRKAAKRKTPKKATSPQAKLRKAQEKAAKKPQKVPKGKARSKS